MRVFDHIAVIFNPKSTGNAPKMARDLSDSVNGHFEVIQKKAVSYPTKSAGDAIDIAKTITIKYEKPLLISVSGDGGYNEVINGAMLGKNASHHPVVAVMPAGNANDHYRVVAGETPLIRLIKRADIKPIDLIHIAVRGKDFELSRYAHSYIGFGITSAVGKALNKHGKTAWNELRVTLGTIKDFTPFALERSGVTADYDSLVFANIKEMAKGVTLSKRSSLHDGKFEVIAIKHRGKLHTIKAIASALIHGFKRPKQYASYRFSLPQASTVQIDGETVSLPDNVKVVITAKADAIDTIF